MAKPKQIELSAAGLAIPILYEDRSVIAVDKPAGWLLAPDSWDQTGRNLQLALESSMNAGDFWAHSRNLRYLRFIHRLDAETTGVLLLARSPGALRAFSELFETRAVEKRYLAVVRGVPAKQEWSCDLPLIPDPAMKGRMRTVGANPVEQTTRRQPGPRVQPASKPAGTAFRVLQIRGGLALVEAHPTTGRTHQIRVHLAACGYPIVGDALYGTDAAAASKGRQKVALRAVRLAYRDPFQKRMIFIGAPAAEFIREYEFDPAVYPDRVRKEPPRE